MLQSTRRRGAAQRPPVTANVIVGLVDVLDALPASFVVGHARTEAVRYLQRLVEFCSSDEYKAMRADRVSRSRACQVRKAEEACA
ncbi:hypothetical protein [Cupriavidus necator]